MIPDKQGYVVEENDSLPVHQDLVRRCIGKERKAQKELYEMYYGRMMSLCRRYFPARDEAMEVLNHGFLKVFMSIDQYRMEGSLDAWIRRVIYHTVIDYVRKKKSRWNESSIETEGDEQHFIDPVVVQNLEMTDMMKMLERLPESSRTVFNMYVIEGYRHAEIAEMLGISEGTSKWHLNNARQKLKILIEP